MSEKKEYKGKKTLLEMLNDLWTFLEENTSQDYYYLTIKKDSIKIDFNSKESE